MKKILIFLTTALLILTACGSSKKGEATSSSSDELSIFIWGEYLPNEVVEEFEEEFGVEVLISNYNDNDEMLTKLKSGAVDYDLAVPTDWMVGRMIQEDLLEELDIGNIPNFENVDDSFQEREYDPENKYSIPYVYGSLGILYNEEMVETPTSWRDLWNPEYKEHLVLQETERAVISFTLQMLGYDYNNPSEEELLEAKEELSNLHPNVLTYTNTPSGEFVSGDAWIGEAHSTEAAIAMKENPNLSYVLPDEGGILWSDNWVIPKTAKNKEAAEDFLNFILDPEVSKEISEEIGGSNPNKEAVKLMDEEEKGNVATYPPEERLDNATWYEYLDPETTKTMQYMWKEIRVQ